MTRRQFEHRLGSFFSPFCTKKSCSPAEKVNGWLQSRQMSVLSWSAMMLPENGGGSERLTDCRHLEACYHENATSGSISDMQEPYICRKYMSERPNHFFAFFPVSMRHSGELSGSGLGTGAARLPRVNTGVQMRRGADEMRCRRNHSCIIRAQSWRRKSNLNGRLSS